MSAKADKVCPVFSKELPLSVGKKFYFGDTGVYITSAADGKILISADGTGTDAITLTGGVTVSNGIVNSALTASSPVFTDANKKYVSKKIDTADITDANVTLAKIVNGTGLSIIGRSANTVGVNADIVGTDGQVARVAGTALGFGTIVAAGIATDAVITAKILAKNVTTAKIADAAITQAQVKTKAVVALADTATTLTATQLIDSGIFTAAPSTARTQTTDTAANIIAALPDYQVGTCFDFTIVVTAAFAETLAAGADVTLVGKMVLNDISGTFRARIDSATAVTIYRM